ncbi:MAG TPA: triose-phosphate isomerase [Phycisphaerae bacterium]|nr:triose-phosphate isomerase [Phycisphaerae bacterium]HQL72259.1 triose-phosphate isomerase [Phycisphaerae bacterium]
MSRKLFIAGNWKMNTTRSGAIELARAVAVEVGSQDQVDVAVCPPLVYLADVGAAIAGSRVALGAQNAYFENEGAFTGEVSIRMLQDVGCRYVILGHSERRHLLGESDEIVNRKVLKALSDGIDVILCVGELLEQREAGQTMDVVQRQVRIGLEGVSQTVMAKVTIAYEPVWAIGTGRVATPAQAQEVHAAIRELVGKLYGAQTAAATRIQYGGSVKASNAAELLAQEDIDGALVGGASLKATEFAGIVRAGM